MPGSEDARACPKCGGTMEPGFLVDVAHGEYRQSCWVAGEPERHWLTGLRLDINAALKVTTYRCVRCGYLESYTPGAGDTLLRPAEGGAEREADQLLRPAANDATGDAP